MFDAKSDAVCVDERDRGAMSESMAAAVAEAMRDAISVRPSRDLRSLDHCAEMRRRPALCLRDRRLAMKRQLAIHIDGRRVDEHRNLDDDLPHLLRFFLRNGSTI